jgi:hypothetical protein
MLFRELIALKSQITAVGIRHADHATPLYQLKLALTSPTSGGRSVSIARSRTRATAIFIIDIPVYYPRLDKYL